MPKAATLSKQIDDTRLYSQLYTYIFIAIAVIVGLFLTFSVVSFATNFKVEQFNKMTGLPASFSASDRLKQVECLARNIYWEAANEPFEGKVAVAQVTINRVSDGRFKEDICGVVYQKNIVYDRVICQFSWFCETNHLTRLPYPKYYEESEAVAKKVLLEGYRLDGLKDALYYHADYVNPRWNKEKIGQIGRHIFYKEKKI